MVTPSGAQMRSPQTLSTKHEAANVRLRRCQSVLEEPKPLPAPAGLERRAAGAGDAEDVWTPADVSTMCSSCWLCARCSCTSRPQTGTRWLVQPGSPAPGPRRVRERGGNGWPWWRCSPGLGLTSCPRVRPSSSEPKHGQTQFWPSSGPVGPVLVLVEQILSKVCLICATAGQRQ